MTECTQTNFGFPSCKSRKITADFSGGNITSNGGVLLLKQADSKLGLTRTAARLVPDNQLRLMLSSLAYVLFGHIRRTALRHTRLAHATSATIRNKLIRIGAVATRNTRRIRFHLSTSYPRQELFTLTAARLE